jgi:hypothetical protein
VKDRERALLAEQWRVKHRRRLNRMRGKAAALSLSTQEWKAKRFSPGARVIARHAGWERWVIYEADSGDASEDEAVAPQDEKFAEVWYFNTETSESSVRWLPSCARFPAGGLGRRLPAVRTPLPPTHTPIPHALHPRLNPPSARNLPCAVLVLTTPPPPLFGAWRCGSMFPQYDPPAGWAEVTGPAAVEPGDGDATTTAADLQALMPAGATAATTGAISAMRLADADGNVDLVPPVGLDGGGMVLKSVIPFLNEAQVGGGWLPLLLLLLLLAAVCSVALCLSWMLGGSCL